MEIPVITFKYLGLFGLLYGLLTIIVVRLRFRLRVRFGRGDKDILYRAIRAHGNLSEYLPIVILLMGGFEALGGNTFFVGIGLFLFLIARLSHIYSMFNLNVQSRAYFFARVFGALTTWLILMAAAIGLIIMSF